MAFQSAIMRSKWTAAGLSLVFDFAIAGVVAFLFNEIWYFVLTIGILWGAAFLVTIRSMLFQIGAYYLFEKKNRLTAVKYALLENNLPVENDYFVDTDEYFMKVAMDKNAPDNARFFAAVTAGQLGMIRDFGMFVFGLQTNAVLEEALTQYFRENGGGRSVDLEDDDDEDNKLN